ncbi:MAG: hypothetical protein Q7S92_05940 [Candidatus Diapherotrites archaeon]|nr:hypothetical protein [Candidatus Diapherotrites archaeon]
MIRKPRISRHLEPHVQTVLAERIRLFRQWQANGQDPKVKGELQRTRALKKLGMNGIRALDDRVYRTLQITETNGFYKPYRIAASRVLKTLERTSTLAQDTQTIYATIMKTENLSREQIKAGIRFLRKLGICSLKYGTLIVTPEYARTIQN